VVLGTDGARPQGRSADAVPARQGNAGRVPCPLLTRGREPRRVVAFTRAAQRRNRAAGHSDACRQNPCWAASQYGRYRFL
jgi:hypothetical protein